MAADATEPTTLPPTVLSPAVLSPADERIAFMGRIEFTGRNARANCGEVGVAP